MRRAAKSHAEAGFTLVEMMMALFIFSILSVGAMSAMFASIQTKDRLSEAVDAVGEIETARALIKSDLANLVLRPTRDPYGNPELYLLSGGVETLLSFTRTGRENPGGLEKRGSTQRVAYVFEGDKLIRRSFAVDNPAPLTPLRDRILIKNIEDASVRFEDRLLGYSQLYVPNDKLKIDVDMFVLTLRFEGGDELVQKFELSP